MGDVILQINDLTVEFNMYDGRFSRAPLRVIDALSMTVRAGEVLAVAGSSGSGKACWRMRYSDCCRVTPRLEARCCSKASRLRRSA